MTNDRRRLFALNESHIALREFAAQLVSGTALVGDFEEAPACAVVIRSLSDATYMDLSGPFDTFSDAQASAMRCREDLREEGDGDDYFVEVRPLYGR